MDNLHHWTLLGVLTVLVAFTNSFYLIKHINFCATCAHSKYIRETARKDVRAMAITFLVLSMIVAMGALVTKFGESTRSGFASTIARFKSLYPLLLYVAMVYNVFAFMNFAAVANKCHASEMCKEKTKIEPFKASWRAIKTLNVIHICVGVSYLLFKFTCKGKERRG